MTSRPSIDDVVRISVDSLPVKKGDIGIVLHVSAWPNYHSECVAWICIVRFYTDPGAEYPIPSDLLEWVA